MCGILGCVIKADKLFDEDLFKKNLNQINHRGPDDCGVFSDGNVMLGSVRLSIQDLSSNGHMPMKRQHNDLVIIFNGEIYNYKSVKEILLSKGYTFRSNTDTEVVLNSYHLWGSRCVEFLEGMFALAIYDTAKKTIFLARDRSGEKPLYFLNSNNYFAFASEIKSILDYGKREINQREFIHYLQFGYTSSEASIISEVKKLKAGTSLLFDCTNNSIVETKYWKLPSFSNSDVALESLVKELDVLLSNSVKKTLVADVPTGVLLSGGLDSSLITAYAAEHISGKVKTFNISFDGNKMYDESDYAETVSKYFDTEHTRLSGNEISYDLLDRIFEYFDEPLADSSILPTFIVSELTRSHVKVALGGDGGDELFGGYTTYRRALEIEKLNRYFHNKALQAIQFMNGYLPLGFKGKNLLDQFSSKGFSGFFRPKFFPDSVLKNLLTLDLRDRINYSDIKDLNYTFSDPIAELTRFDFENYLVEDILCKIDRASMANSLELRAPWLDKSIVEFAFTKVSSKFKAHNGRLKILPKELAKIRLPNNLNIERKQGFSIPIHSWATTMWYTSIKEDLLQLPSDVFNIEYALYLLDSLKRGRSNEHLVFCLIAFSKWYNKYNVKFN